MNDTTLRTALGAIIDGDGPQGTAGTMQNLCGRTTNLLVDWDSRHKATPPFLALLLVASQQDAGSGNYWDVLAQFECVARPEDGGLGKCDSLADRLSAILTHTNLWGQIIDAAPVGLLRHRGVPAQDELLQEGWAFKLFEMELFVK